MRRKPVNGYIGIEQNTDDLIHELELSVAYERD